MHTNIVDVENICKSFKVSKRRGGLLNYIANIFIPRYEIKKAVNDISFSIKEGDTVGLIGSNGAGKSTTIKILSGILYPDSGEISVAGYIPYKERKKYVENIGVVFGQKSQLAWDLPLIDSLELIKKIYRIPKKLYDENLDIFKDLLGLEEFIYQPVRQLSLGQRMRADIAAALLHSPKLVFLDEPTIGLDVVAKQRIREFLKHINKEKKVTLIFTTHDMADIEQTCKRLIIIDKGEKIFDGTIDEIKHLYRGERKLIMEFAKVYDIIYDVPGLIKNRLSSIKYEFIISENKIKMNDLVSHMITNYEVIDLSIVEPSIERIVRQVYEEGICVQ